MEKNVLLNHTLNIHQYLDVTKEVSINYKNHPNRNHGIYTSCIEIGNQHTKACAILLKIERNLFKNMNHWKQIR